MTTSREDPTKRDLPGGAAKPPKEPASPPIGATEPEKKKIDPWHFGAHTVPPGLRAQLSAIELPDAPEERRYRPQAAKAETAADSAAPLATEEPGTPKRDFRRSVAVAFGLLVVVGVALAVFRCSTAATESPAASTEVATTSAVAPPSTNAPSEPSALPAEPPTTLAPTVATPSAAREPAGATVAKPKPSSVQPQPASGLPAAPLPSASDPAQGGDTKSFRVEPR